MNDMLEIDEDDFYCLDEEGLSLTDEQIAEAVKISNLVTVQSSKWQVYLNALARSGFSNWLEDRDDDLFSQLRYSTPAIDNVQVGEFKVCIIAIGSTDEDFISIPQSILKNPNELAHFYVIVRVLEEIAQASIYGFIRYDQLKVRRVEDFLDGTCDFPIEWLTLDPDELLSYLRCLNPGAILLPELVPTVSIGSIASSTSEKLKKIGESGWQDLKKLWADVRAAIDIEGTNLLMPNMAFRGANKQGTILIFGRNTENINTPDLTTSLGDGFRGQNEIFILEFERDYQDDDKVKICIEVKSADETLLSEGIYLEVFSPTRQLGDAVVSNSDNITIQRKFTVKRGISLEIKVTFNDECITHERDV
jgi:hypothetical protein